MPLILRKDLARPLTHNELDGNFEFFRDGESEIVTTTNIILDTETNKVFYLDNVSGFVSTLPAPAVGLNFEFIVRTAPTGGNYQITTDGAAAIISGGAYCVTGDGVAFSNNTSLDFIQNISLKGDRVKFISDGTSWYIDSHYIAAGGVTAT